MIIVEKREHYIDWIRVLAFLILIFFHCSMPFVTIDWEIKDTNQSVALTRLILWLHQWRLPLLFFIAGVGVSYSLRKRNAIQFFGERVVRLFIPLLFAMFFLTPIQVYFERLQKGQIDMSYWEFFPSVFELVPYPEGTLTWSHLWFVVYLFVFTILLLPVFAFFKIRLISRLKQRLDGLFRSPITNLVLSTPFILFYFTLYIKWPVQGSLLDDWFLFNSSMTFYFFGFFLADLPTFWNTCERHRRLFLALSVFTASILIVQYYWTLELPKAQDSNLYWYGLLNGLQIWSIILTSVGYGKRYLNFSNQYLAYLTPAVYPFYILHQTIIVASGYYIVQLPIPLIVKMLLLIVVCFTTIAVSYHFVIKRFVLTRLLFGVKLRTAKTGKIIPYASQAEKEQESLLQK
jgi:glucans biosynthesis protein C